MTVADPNTEFSAKTERALRDLFERAKAANELHFAMALMPEFRGLQDAGWNTAQEAIRAYDEFLDLIESMSPNSSIRARIILAFYNHVAEGSGFYETPKKLLLTISGQGNNIVPFQSLVERHRKTGDAIAPNANRIMKDMIGHALELGLNELAEVFRDAFDPDVRNAVAHADYIIWSDGLRLRRRNGGQVRAIRWDDFAPLVNRGLGLFASIRNIRNEYVKNYNPPKTILAQLDADEPKESWTIYYDPKAMTFGVTTEQYPPNKPLTKCTEMVIG